MMVSYLYVKQHCNSRSFNDFWRHLKKQRVILVSLTSMILAYLSRAASPSSVPKVSVPARKSASLNGYDNSSLEANGAIVEHSNYGHPRGKEQVHLTNS
ncbi:hypothetical protein CEXT_736081 [Caerostris extrusa]|uniref:Uncharacterized protein n=1 Tax=Caerostris extrusa TaxID=172846 RepID=A0AAV4TKP6_CAEEX|nr:hypothetical protein CEXT_736081 [Caerostris extrusa]